MRREREEDREKQMKERREYTCMKEGRERKRGGREKGREEERKKERKKTRKSKKRKKERKKRRKKETKKMRKKERRKKSRRRKRFRRRICEVHKYYTSSIYLLLASHSTSSCFKICVNGRSV